MTDVPVEPRKRNWRPLGVLAIGALVLLIALIVFAMLNRRAARQDVAERHVSTSTVDRLAQKDFGPAGYPLPPAQPAQPAPPLPPPPPPARSPAATLVTTTRSSAPQIAKPMASMFSTDTDTAAVPPAQAVATPPIKPGEAVGTGTMSEAEKWLASKRGGDIVEAPYMPAPRFLLQAGTIMRAVLVTELNSDLPGTIVAQITEDAFDTPTGQFLLVPAGARLLGTYNDKLAYGQSRAQIAWTRILMPDGRSQNIGTMAGTDASGASGVEGEVDRHPWAMAGVIAGSALFSVVGQAGSIINAATGGNSGSGNTDVNVGPIAAQGAGNASESLWNRMGERELNRPNTLRVRAGSPVAVLLSRDIVTLTPYEAVR